MWGLQTCDASRIQYSWSRASARLMGRTAGRVERAPFGTLSRGLIAIHVTHYKSTCQVVHKGVWPALAFIMSDCARGSLQASFMRRVQLAADCAQPTRQEPNCLPREPAQVPSTWTDRQLSIDLLACLVARALNFVAGHGLAARGSLAGCSSRKF